MQFSLDRPLKSEILRVGADLIGHSIGHLANFGSPDLNVHETRTLLKKLRSLLAFVEPGISASNGRAANHCWREVARELAPARESVVRMRTIEALGDRYPELIDAAAVAPVLEDLKASHEALLGTLESGDRLRALCSKLEASREWLHHFDVDRGQPAAGLTATYRRAAKWIRRAADSGKSEDFHEWRKHVKHLWYQHQMIQAAWPQVLDAWAMELQALSRALGNEHDLADLEQALDSGPVATVVSGRAATQIHRALGEERRTLRSQALRLGRLIHAEPSKNFGRRYDVYVIAGWLS